MEKKLGRIKDYDKTLPVLELYTAVQSEGSRAGYPTIVVRTTGCTHRCFFRDGGWCDSFYTSIHHPYHHHNQLVLTFELSGYNTSAGYAR